MHTIGWDNKYDRRSASVYNSSSKIQQSFGHMQLAEFRIVGGTSCCKYASDYSVGSGDLVSDKYKYPLQNSPNTHPQTLIILINSHPIISKADSASFFRLKDKIKNPNRLRPFAEVVSTLGFILLRE